MQILCSITNQEFNDNQLLLHILLMQSEQTLLMQNEKTLLVQNEKTLLIHQNKTVSDPL